MQLTADESQLIEALRRLPSPTAEELSALVHRLAELPDGTRVDWSDSWSDEDLDEYTKEAARRLDSEDN